MIDLYLFTLLMIQETKWVTCSRGVIMVWKKIKQNKTKQKQKQKQNKILQLLKKKNDLSLPVDRECSTKVTKETTTM